MLKQLFVVLGTAVKSVCNFRWCIAPMGIAAFAISVAFFVGAGVCRIPSSHVVFDLVVAVSAVVFHLALHALLQRFHDQR